jgi:pilus assembly protein CpaE
MQRLKVLIASRSKSAAADARAMLQAHGGCDVDVFLMTNGSADPLQGVARMPDLLVLYDQYAQPELEILRSRAANSDMPALLVFGPGDDPLTIRLAMRAGSRDYLTVPLQQGELFEIVDAIAGEFESTRTRSVGSMHVFMNGKGGSGATFLATNVAHGLARDGHKVTLVDLDLQVAGLSRYLDLVPKQDVFEAMRAVDDLDELAAKAFTTEHDSGLRVLAATGDQLRMNQDVDPDRLIKLLSLYRTFNDFVIVDLPRNIDAVNAAVLEASTHVTLVTQQTFPHLHDTARLLGILATNLHIDKSRVSVVLNRYSKNLSVTVQDVEGALDVSGIVRVPNHFRLASESVNSGIPLGEVDDKSSVSRGLRELYAQLGMSEESARPGVFSTLFRR